MTDNCRAAKCLRLFSLQEEEDDEQRTVFFFYFLLFYGGPVACRTPHTHTHSRRTIRQRDGKSLIELLLLASMMDNGARDSLVISASCVCNRARRGGFKLPNMQIIFLLL